MGQAQGNVQVNLRVPPCSAKDETWQHADCCVDDQLIAAPSHCYVSRAI
jgi:hypothetical protein